MSVKLRQKINLVKDKESGKQIPTGTVSLYLDIYHNGKRKYEFLEELKLYFKPPSVLEALKVQGTYDVSHLKQPNPIDKQKNKLNYELAQKIATKRAHDLTSSDYHMVTDIGRKTLVIDWMQDYIDKYKKADKRNMQGALNRFKDFLAQEKIRSLTFGQINELTVSDFQDYLKANSVGEGASSYFNRFKKMMKRAKMESLMLENPALKVPTTGGKARKKDVLTLEEIQLLADTPTDSDNVKRAFLFSLMTGLRWSDVKALTWHNVNLKEGFINLPQAKTGEDVQINLNSTAVELIGEPGGDPVFELPTANGANKTLKAWVKRAGINKKITWHNARHSFGTNLIFTGTDVTVASSLLGHTSLKHTQRYVRAAKELKERATDNLTFNFKR